MIATGPGDAAIGTIMIRRIASLGLAVLASACSFSARGVESYDGALCPPSIPKDGEACTTQGTCYYPNPPNVTPEGEQCSCDPADGGDGRAWNCPASF